MIIYQENKRQFCDDVFSNRIDQIIYEQYQAKTGKRVGSSEQDSWRNSMNYMERIVSDGEIPHDSKVTIEFHIPGASQRIDFIISGCDDEGVEHAVLVELKQWSDIETTTMDGVVRTRFKHGVTDTNHPCYQVWSYAAQLENFNETVYEENVILKPCAYLHNYPVHLGKINDEFYGEYIQKAPLFLMEDALKLRAFIKQFIKKGDAKNLMYRIDGGRIRPSKGLADSLSNMLKGSTEFIMIDDQKLVYEKALQLLKVAEQGKDQVLIVQGGPGTGKSVVAINLLVEAHKRAHTAHYVTKNAAPRGVFQAKLTGTLNQSQFSSLFKGSGSYIDADYNMVDLLIVDEAHRLNEKSGLFSNLGVNQVAEIMHACKLSIYFIDEDQRIHFKDIGSTQKIAEFAELQGCEVTQMQLTSQFRCNGSNGYLAWLDNVLQIRETANYSLDAGEYDFRVIDNPAELRDLIYEKNKVNNKARMVAGYCWDWKSKKDRDAYDIVFEEYDFKHRWNLLDHGSKWIIHPDSVTEIGCIHTCQGLEVDYIGVIIGDDFVIRNGVVVTDAGKRSGGDQSIKGYKTMLKKDPEATKEKADKIIKNTYRTLMTRGMKGCYIYCTDKETSEYFKELMINK